MKARSGFVQDIGQGTKEFEYLGIRLFPSVPIDSFSGLLCLFGEGYALILYQALLQDEIQKSSPRLSVGRTGSQQKMTI